MNLKVTLVLTMVHHCAWCLSLPGSSPPVSSASLPATDIPVLSFAQDLIEIGRSRATMLFPLLLGISARLATLVPTFLIGLFGIFLFVAFSKKALIISLLALLLSYIDKHKNHRPKIVHIHHPTEIEYDHHPHKWLDFHKKPLRKWPKHDVGPWGYSGPAMEDSYLPQPARRSGVIPFLYSTNGVGHFPKYSMFNASEPVQYGNSTMDISPKLQAFIQRTLMEEDEDPR